ncbi:hypothetical protein LIER_11140 [Lithospermum erythrorhizon]|uniref:DUF4005 domain-containing protein n=1 Tax=Lithospermum erythrorhizon TaxID=34254 RepID=A0AAV3PRA8_LITER
MGKASRWIRSFLLGNREKHKKIDRLLLSAGSLRDLNVLPKAPQEKRRWSFKKSFTSPDISINHRRSRSFDTLLVKQTLQDCDVERIRTIVSGTQRNGAIGTLAPTESRATRMQGGAAATKIQSIFRSYLARKALRALKGLVKIQAVVRGYLVRKQTSAMIKRMQALMSIQIRARIQRVHLNEESQFVYEHRFSHGKSLQNYLDLETINSRSRRIGRPQAQRRKDSYNFGKIYDRSGRRSFSKLQQINETPSTWLASQSSPELYKESNRMYQPKQEDINTTQTTLPFAQPYIEDSYALADSQFVPAYMSNTESSKAKSKARSKSEPKQRPARGTEQAGGKEYAMDLVDNKRQHPWPVNLYQ